MRISNTFMMSLAVLSIFISDNIFGGIPTNDQLPNYNYRPFIKPKTEHPVLYFHNAYLLLPKEAPLDYYSKKDMKRWYPDSITKVNGWVRLWVMLKIDRRNPDYFSDILIFITDDRTGKKYGKARIIAAQHRRRIGYEGREKTIFCAHDKSYLDSTAEEVPDWRIIETNDSITCNYAVEQIIKIVIRNAGDKGWITQNIHDFRQA